MNGFKEDPKRSQERLSQHEIFTRVNQQLENAMVGKTHVLYDKFGMTGRNVYLSPYSIPKMKPDVIMCDFDNWDDKLQSQVFSKEAEKGIRESNGTNYDKILLPRLISYLKLSNKQPVISSWYESDRRSELASSTNGLLLCISKQIRETLEDKTNFHSILDRANVPLSQRLKTQVYGNPSELPSYKALVDSLGEKFVIQGKSMGGDGTYIIKGEDDLYRVCHNLNEKIRVVEFCPAQYFSTNVLTIPDPIKGCRVYIDSPSHKANNIRELGISEVAGAGQDWSLPYPRKNVEDIVKSIHKIGTWAFQEHGLIGIWGIEGFCDGSDIYFGEINCRPGGDTEVSSTNQLLRGFPPFTALHTLAFLKQDLQWLPTDTQFNQETINYACSFTRKPFYLRVRSKSNKKQTLTNDFQGNGIYKLDIQNQELIWARHGSSTLEANFDDLEVLIADAPKKGIQCDPGVQLCNIEGITSINHIFNQPDVLSNYGVALASSIYKIFTNY